VRTTTTTTSDAIDQSPPQITTVSIPGGLRGIVATEISAASATIQSLPDQETWCDLIASIVNDSSSLPGYEVLKYSGGNEVFRATLTWGSGDTSESIDVVCKKTVSPGGLKGLADSFRSSRARKNFDRGLLLMTANIATPLPLAAIDRARPRTNWLITEFLPDLVDLDRIALADLPQIPSDQQRETKDAIIKATSNLFARLEKGNLFHRDLKASNILLDGWQRPDHPDKPLRTVLVDLDGLHKTARTDSTRWKPLVRLAASLRDYPSLSRTDFVRFLKTYLAATDDPAWRDHFRRLSQQAEQYAEKSRARKAHKLDGYT